MGDKRVCIFLQSLMRKSLNETVKDVLGFKDNVVSSLNLKWQKDNNVAAPKLEGSNVL